MTDLLAASAAPSHVRAHVSHRRTRPFTYEFAHRTSMWLVDASATGHIQSSHLWGQPSAWLSRTAPR